MKKKEKSSFGKGNNTSAAAVTRTYENEEKKRL